MVFEDIHWADSLSLNIVNIAFNELSPTLIICTSRLIDNFRSISKVIPEYLMFIPPCGKLHSLLCGWIVRYAKSILNYTYENNKR